MKEITTSVKLKPFRAPNYVIVDTPPRPRSEGFQEAPKYHVSELSEETLNALCDQFREDVMAKAAAGKPEDMGP